MKQHHRTLIILALAVTMVCGMIAVLLRYDAGLSGVARTDLEGTEDAGGRAEWELMRLRDPKTGRIPDGIRDRELAFAATLPKRESFMLKPMAGGVSNSGWVRRGPNNIGGRTRALAIDITDEQVLLAGGATGGMWRSSDGGATWGRVTQPSQHPGVSCVAQDTRPGRTSVWYYGTGEIHGSTASIDQARYSGDGIFKSTDGGRSWSVLPSTLGGSATQLDNSFEYVWNIAVDRSNMAQDEVYAAVFGGIKRSTDGGVTWRDVLGNFQNGAKMTDVAVTSQGVVYATLSSNGTTHGLWRSADGIAWTKITPAGWPSNTGRIVIGIPPSNENIVYFLGETPFGGLRVGGSQGEEWHSFWKYTYVSGDGTGAGGVWVNRSNNLPSVDASQFSGFRSQRGFDLAIRVKPDTPDVVFIGGTNLYRSGNGFASRAATRWIGGYKPSIVWMDISYPNHHPDQHALAFLPSNSSILYSGHDGGISKTTDATADSVVWESLNNGYVTTQLYALSIDQWSPGDPTIIAGMQDNSSWMTRSADPAAPWVQVGPGDGGFSAIAQGGSAYYVTSQYGRVYRVALDQQGSVDRWARIDPQSTTSFLFVAPMGLDPSDPSILYHISVGDIWRNSNPTAIPLDSSQTAKSLNWRRVMSNSISQLTAFGVSKENPEHRMYVGTRNGGVHVMDGVHSGTVAPRDITGSLPEGYVSCIAVDPGDGDHALVVFSNYNVVSLFATTDGGESWTPVAGNLEQNGNGSGDGPSCRWATIMRQGNEMIYLVGTSTGLYSTTKLSGMSTVWMMEGASTIGNAVVNMVVGRAADGFVAVATHGAGVFSTTLHAAGVDPESPAAQSNVRLHDIVPNPVRTVATIRFTLRSSGGVRLALYDLAGRRIASLLDAPMAAGEHSVPFDAGSIAGGLPSGRYYVRIESEKGMEGGSVVVVR